MKLSGVKLWLALLLMGCPLRALAQTAPLAPPTEAGHFDVALHARSMKASARSEQAAWLTLTVPLDRVATPQPRVNEAPVPPAATPEGAEATADSETDASDGSVPRLSFAQLHALAELMRGASAVALSVIGARGERERLERLASRSRSSALLPEVRLRVVRNTDQALRWVPTTDDPYRVTQADGAGLILEASATFRLDRLVFTHEELLVERLRRRLSVEHLKLEARVQHAVLELFRQRELGCAEDPNSAARGTHLLSALTQFTELDTLTAGWFSEQAPQASRALWGFPEAILGACEPPPPAPRTSPTIPVASLNDSE
jgi:hypothetical protein